ncbi:hypothetical protein [Paraburkholderia acidipaludis]|uniref:hypothetical protein n=1 Tax=Paraburkholderia acidipaludis TaxID=660537 RepID=UPI0012EC2BEB|nr:hypothetical protein [Paraburkholderia acidipaludis]
MSGRMHLEKTLSNGSYLYRCWTCGYSAAFNGGNNDCPVCRQNDLLEKQTKIMSQQTPAISTPGFDEAVTKFIFIVFLEAVATVGLALLLPDSWSINISILLGTGLVLAYAWTKDFGKWIAISFFALTIIGCIGNLLSGTNTDSKQSATPSRTELLNRMNAEDEKRKACNNIAPANWDDECRHLLMGND